MVSLYSPYGYKLIALAELELVANLLPVGSVELEHQLLRDFLDGSLCQHQRFVLQHGVHVKSIDRHNIHEGNRVSSQSNVLRDEVGAKSERKNIVSHFVGQTPELTRQ